MFLMRRICTLFLTTFLIQTYPLISQPGNGATEQIEDRLQYYRLQDQRLERKRQGERLEEKRLQEKREERRRIERKLEEDRLYDNY